MLSKMLSLLALTVSLRIPKYSLLRFSGAGLVLEMRAMGIVTSVPR